jgi:UDP-N-acetylmuramoyl-tripeptide--D-alanyl-D-alanine ligase
MDLTIQEMLRVKNYPFEYRGPAEKLTRAIAGISTDSRKIQADEIYFALRGEHHNGHDFVRECLDHGALAAAVEKSWLKKHDADFKDRPLLPVENTLIALQELAHYYRQKFGLPLLGLTGTNGKTTTKEMIAAVLAEMGSVCKTEGNLNNHIGVPLTLLTLRPQHKSAVIEMGTNHFGEISRLCEIAEPQLGVITNIGRGHLEFFGDLEGVARAKMELFHALPSDGKTFVNLDDPLIVKHTPKRKTNITFGFNKAARIKGKLLEPDKQGFPKMQVDGQIFRLNLMGRHNLSNALAAVAVGLEFGIGLKTMSTALENITLPSKRLEVSRRNHILILNDSYNANPDSTLAALAILRDAPITGKRIFVFGDMLELGEAGPAEHAHIGESLTHFRVDVFFAFGPLAAAAVTAAQKSGAKLIARHFSDKHELVAELKKILTDGDGLLVKGSRGMKMEEVLEGLFNG